MMCQDSSVFSIDSIIRKGLRALGIVLWPVLLLALLTCHVLAVPHNGEETFTYRQPDGATFQVRLWGDEFFAYQETLDGYLIIRDPDTRFFCYARVIPDGTSIVSTGIKVGAKAPAGLARHQRLKGGVAFEKSRELRKLLGRDEKGRFITSERSIKAPPSSTTTGLRVGLVLLASFPDQQQDVSIISRAQVDAYCNDPTYSEFENSTSVYGYFYIQSDGKLSYNLIVTSYFTTQYDRDYYTDPAASGRAGEMISEGLQVLDDAGFDFTQCDGDGDGRLDGINCFYAGFRVNAWAEGLWPHASGLTWSGFAAHGLDASASYQVTDLRDELSLGTFCHENGHMLCGFPDLYEYNDNAANVGGYSLMSGAGSKHPVSVDPHLKIAAGWADVVDLNSSSHQLCAVQEDRNHFYRYRNPSNPQEYFLFELRNNNGYEGPYGGHSGSVNPDTGLVVYHALETGANTTSSIFTENNPTNDYSTPFELLVVEATPAAAVTPWYDDPTPKSSDAFHAGGSNELSDTTFPAMKFWTSSGRTSNSACHVHSVSATNIAMTFIVGTGPLVGAPGIGLTVTALAPTADLGDDADSDTFGVYNISGGTLSYSITTNAAWLSVSPASGTATTECDLITITYDTAGMTSGVYAAEITVTDGAATNSPQTVPVTLTIADASAIELSTNALSATLAPGVEGVELFEIRNGGGGTMNYTLSENLFWLSLDGTNGVVSAGLAQIAAIFSDHTPSGTYTGTITVASSDATNSPQTVSVSLTVTGNTRLFVVSPDGGETFYTGEPVEITWNSSTSLVGNLEIDLLYYGQVVSNLAANTSNDSSFDWTPAALGGDGFRIRITSISDPTTVDESDIDFSIRTRLHDENMDIDPGYSVSNGDWEYGNPSNNIYGGPKTAYTGTNIYDTNLDGAAFNTTYLTTPVIDCSNHENVSLTFAGEFSVYTGFAAVVQITTNGSSWTNLFYIKNNNDSGWQLHSYDLSSTADGEANVQIRWGHLREPGGVNWSGMAIDDVLMSGTYATPAGTHRDFGDLPAGYNLTTLSDNGARHATGPVYLGTSIDGETNGIESATAVGDDSDGTDDEDGITVSGSWQEGTGGGAVQVVVTGGSGYLSAWIDWDGNNQFTDAGDQVLNMAAVSIGTQTNTFDVPSGAIPAAGSYTNFARFRLWTNSTPVLTTSGLVVNGEVEDYQLIFTGVLAPPAPSAPVAIAATNITSSSFFANWNAVGGATDYRLDVFEIDEDFGDGDATAHPVWQGNSSDYEVITNSTLPNGSAATDGLYLASTGSVDKMLIMASTEVNTWRFSLGTPDVNPSDANNVGVVLMSDSAISGDIASATFQGYYLRIGNNSTADRVRLYRSTGIGKVQVGEFNTPDFGTGGLKDGLTMKVTRDGSGVFHLYYQSGFENVIEPANDGGTLTNADYSASSYFGVWNHFSTPDPDRRVYIDNIVLGEPDYVSGYSNRTVSATTESVTGLGANTYYYYQVRSVGPGGTSTNSNVITVKTLAEAPVAIAATSVTKDSFIANWNAVTGALDYRLDVFEPNEDFNDGDFTSDPVWQGDTGDFGVITNSPLPNGDAATDGSYLASTSTSVDKMLIVPSTEVSKWRFSLGTPDVNPSDANNVGVVLMSDSAISGDIASATFQGYYLRIGNNSTADRVRLYRSTGIGKVQVGEFNTPDFGTGGLKDGLTMKVTRDGSGVFHLYYEAGFTGIAEPSNDGGVLTNSDYSVSSYFGVWNHFSTPDADRRVYIDNIVFGSELTYVTGYSNRTVSATSESVTGLSESTEYLYKVRAVSTGGASPDSNAISAVTPADASQNIGAVFFFR